MLGGRFADDVRAAVPGVELVEVPFADPPDPSLRGEVLFGTPFSPNLVPLADRGARWVHITATGIDHVPPELWQPDRVVTCSRGASAIPIAEWVMAAVLARAKRFPDVWLREPPERWNFHPMDEINGQTIGLVGLGGIGVEVARRALALGMEVVAVRRHADRPSPIDGVRVVAELDEMLRVADHIVLAAPATARTRSLLDTRAFSVVKPGVHVVNIARGALIDQDALRVALDDGRVAAATLDVCDPEPLPAGHWLYSHPNVRLSAHVSWGSPHAMDRMVAIFVAELRRYVAGEPLTMVVDRAEGY